MSDPSQEEILDRFDPTGDGGEHLAKLDDVVEATPSYEADDGPLSECDLQWVREEARRHLPIGTIIAERALQPPEDQ